METYDRILRFNEDNKLCVSCYNWNADSDGYGLGVCVDKKANDCNGKKDYYANADQLPALIKEAESGAHQWVRNNTLFVCSEFEQCDSKYGLCDHKKPHKWSVENECPGVCKYHNKKGLCLPYRGDKSEKVTWLGRSDYDCSEVEDAHIMTESEYNQGKEFKPVKVKIEVVED